MESIKDGSISYKESDVYIEHHDLSDTFPDPDVGKSAEERAALVRRSPIFHIGLHETRLKIKQDRKVMLKVDLWLIPWLCLLYLLSFLDRTNVGNARLAGLEEDLGMKGHDYNNALTIFFVSTSHVDRISRSTLAHVFYTG